MPQRPPIAALITGCLATASAVASDPGWNFSGLGETHLIVSHPTGSGRGAIQIFHDSSSTPSAPTAQTNSLGDGAVYIFDLSTRPVKHITTADASHVIRNDVAAHELFGSVLAYDDLQSTDGYDIVLIGSVDPASYGTSPAQFIFSRHRVGYQGVLSTQSTPSISEGDVIPDGKIEDSDVNAVTTNLNQPGTGITTDPDLNGDGIITGSDLVIVLTNYGTVSSLNTMLADPSELVTRVSQLTSSDGGLTVEPGIGGPWTEPICEMTRTTLSMEAVAVAAVAAVLESNRGSQECAPASTRSSAAEADRFVRPRSRRRTTMIVRMTVTRTTVAAAVHPRMLRIATPLQTRKARHLSDGA